MEPQFALFERPEKKGINQTSQDVAPFNECERLENSYKEYLHHCKRVKSQARLPNEILDTLQQQISSGMDTEIILGLLYCILTNNNPSCNYPWDYLKDLKISNKSIISNALSKLVDDYILYITSDALNQIFWFLDVVLKSKFHENNTNKFVTQMIVCVMRHIDVNRVTRYSLNLSQSVQKFIFNHLDWMVELNKTDDRIFIHQVIYLFLRLIENHDHMDLQQSRKDEVRFVSRLFDKFPDSWTGIGRDFIRLFEHLYPIESFTQYWGLIDNDQNSSKLVEILDIATDPLILQICISKQEQDDLIELCHGIEKQKDLLVIKTSIESFVDKYLRRNKLAEHSCDVIRFVMSCYNRNNNKNNKNLPTFHKKDIFLFNLLFYFFGRTWKNEVRSFIYEAMLMEVLYCRPNNKLSSTNKAICNSADIIDRVLQHGSTRQPDITANFMILILETVRHYKHSLNRGSTMRTLPFQSVVHFFKTSPQKSHLMMKRKDFADKYQNLVNQFKKEFDILYTSSSSSSSSSSTASSTASGSLSASSSPSLAPIRMAPKKIKLEFEDNFKSSTSIPSTTCNTKSLSSSPKPIVSSTTNSIKPINEGPNYHNDIENIRKKLNKFQSEQLTEAISTKLNELKQPLIDYYTIKLIEMAQIRNDKQKRNVTLRLNESLKNIKKITDQILKGYGDHLNELKGSHNSSKRNTFIDKMAKGLVNIFGMDYNYCFLLPDQMSSIWNIILNWASKSKINKSPANRNKNNSNDPGFQFDLDENKILLLKSMCAYKEDVKYIIMLYDSKKPEAKGFIKHLGVIQRKQKQNNIISKKLAAMHGWNKNQVEGVKINAHSHGLLYGRRPFESIVCDLCEKDWSGSSWHCQNGCDFDTCHDCFVKYLERKQLYRAVLYLRSKYDNIKLKTSSSSNTTKKNKITLCSELFYDDIKKLQSRSCLLLSAIHQYLFYSYSCYIHCRVMDFIQIVLEVINPLQVQSLCKDIQLALFQLFDNDDLLNQLPKYIEISLRFPQYIQLSFWILLNAFLRTRTNADELFIKSLKYLIKLKRCYIKNTQNVNVWITSTAMDGFLNWTQIIHKSKKIEEIYDILLSFPTKSNYLIPNDDEDNDIKMDNNNNNNNKNELRSMSPSTTVFNASYSSFDEFHIQALVQLLSLKSPRWKSWLQIKLDFLTNKYQQKQVEYEENDEFVSLNKARKRRTEIICNVSIDKFDEGYLLNLLKFYEYLTFVEPNIRDNTVSVMANSFLYDANQRNILVKFFDGFSSLQYFKDELADFWPPESSKSVSKEKRTDSVSSTLLLSPINNNKEKNIKSTADRIQALLDEDEIGNDLNKNKNKNKKKSTKTVKRKKRKRSFVGLTDSNNDSDEDYDENDDRHDKELSEESDDDDDDVNIKGKERGKRSKMITKTKHKKDSIFHQKISKKHSFLNETSNQSDSSSTSSVGRKKNKNQGKYRRNDNKKSSTNLLIPSPYTHNVSSSSSNRKETSPLTLIPKRKPCKQFSPSPISSISSIQSNKRPRTQSNVDNNNNNRNINIQQPPFKKRKISGNSPNKDLGTAPNIRRSISNTVVPKKYSNNNNNNNDNFKRSPNRKRKRQIHDSSDEDDTSHQLFSKQKQKQKHNVSVSYEYDDDDDDDLDDLDDLDDDLDEEEEDSLANRYSSPLQNKRSNMNTNTNTNNNGNETAESWFS